MAWQAFIPWVDLLWIPVALLTEEKGQKILTALFAGSCALLLRLQIELLGSLGFAGGFLHLIDMTPLVRGQIVYGLFIAVFLILAYLSKGVNNHVHVAASITLMLSAFCISSIVMIL